MYNRRYKNIFTFVYQCYERRTAFKYTTLYYLYRFSVSVYYTVFLFLVINFENFYSIYITLHINVSRKAYHNTSFNVRMSKFVSLIFFFFVPIEPKWRKRSNCTKWFIFLIRRTRGFVIFIIFFPSENK